MMNKLFGKPMTMDEQVRKWKVSLKQQERQLDRQIRSIEMEEAKLKKTLIQASKAPNPNPSILKTMAKELVASRKAKDRIHTSKAQLNSVSMQLQQTAATVKMAGTIGKSTEIMKMMNGLIRLPQIRDTMMEMSKEMMKAGIIEEMMQESLNGVLDGDEESTDELANEEVDKIVQSVMMGEFGKVGSLGTATKSANASSEVVAADDSAEPNDNEMDDMKSRLASLRS